MRLRSFGKINLHLQVLGERRDGYHELATVFQTIDLCDELVVEPRSSGVDLRIAEGAAPDGSENLAYRAAELYLERFAPDRGVRLELYKRLPVGGGLGGGSSDAATVLWALEHLWRAAGGLELRRLASGLGADVAYFLLGGTAWGEGRGDILRELPQLPEEEIWLVTPPVEVSTAEVFRRLRELTPRPLPSSIQRLAAGAAVGGVRQLDGFNDLESVVFETYPPVRAARRALREAGAGLVRMSGSGSTLYAMFETPPDDAALRRHLPEGTRVTATRTLSRGSIAERRIIEEGG